MEKYRRTSFGNIIKHKEYIKKQTELQRMSVIYSTI